MDFGRPFMSDIETFVNERERLKIFPECLLRPKLPKKVPLPEVFSKPKIVSLLVGKDPAVLETRSMVLRSVGYTVISCPSAQEALNIFLAGDFDVVVLCHSIPITERKGLAKAIHDHSPSTPVVLVCAGFRTQDSSVDAVIENEPKQLLQELPKLLHTSPGRSHLDHRRSNVD